MMTGKNRRILFLCTFLALLVAAGCAFPGRSRKPTFLETLQSQLYSEDAATADRAALVLLSSENEDAYKILKSALAETTPVTTRAAVIRAFITQRDPRIKSEMLVALGDKSDAIVDLAKTYLARVVGTEAADNLLAIARDRSRASRERVAALVVLAEVGGADSVEGLLDLLTDQGADVVEAAGNALRKITYQPFDNDANAWRDWYAQNRKLTREQWQRVGTRYLKQTDELKAEIESLQQQLDSYKADMFALYKRQVDLGMQLQRYEVVIDVLRDAKTIEAQIYAAEALAKTPVPQAVAVLVEKAPSPDVRLAKAAIDALGLVKDPAAAPVIASRLSAGDAALRLAAVKAYAALPQSDLAGLMPLVTDTFAEVRAAVARAIANRPWPDGAQALLGLVEDKVPDVRAAAAEALGQVGGKSSIAPLVVLTADTDEKARFAAVRSLSALAEKLHAELLEDGSSFDALLQATRDSVARVRDAAAFGLAKIGDKRAVSRLLEMVLTETADEKVADQAWQSLVVLVDDDAELILSISEKLQTSSSPPDADKFAKAEVLLKKLASPDLPAETPETLEARRRLAEGYLALNPPNYQAARLYFQLILDRHPDDPDALAGITVALESLGDFDGLARLHAARIAAGTATPQIQADFLTVLGKLLDNAKYAAVVQSAQQVLSSPAPLDPQFLSDLKQLHARALPIRLKELVTDLANPKEAVATAAKTALAAYRMQAARALVDGLEDPAEVVRTASLALLVPLADGASFNFDPKVPPGDQPEALAQWRSWLDSHEKQ